MELLAPVRAPTTRQACLKSHEQIKVDYAMHGQLFSLNNERLKYCEIKLEIDGNTVVNKLKYVVNNLD